MTTRRQLAALQANEVEQRGGMAAAQKHEGRVLQAFAKMERKMAPKRHGHTYELVEAPVLPFHLPMRYRHWHALALAAQRDGNIGEKRYRAPDSCDGKGCAPLCRGASVLKPFCGETMELRDGRWRCPRDPYCSATLCPSHGSAHTATIVDDCEAAGTDPAAGAGVGTGAGEGADAGFGFELPPLWTKGRREMAELLALSRGGGEGGAPAAAAAPAASAPTAAAAPAYKQLRANRYPEAALRNAMLTPAAEWPVCSCAKRPGGGGCGPDSDCENRAMMIECDPTRCAGGAECGNCTIQTGAYPPTQVFLTPNGCGHGLRVLCDVEEGATLCEYRGEVIDKEECTRRLHEKAEGKRGDPGAVYYAALTHDLILDAETLGAPARFANHSCAPNCLMQRWSVRGEPRVVIVAARDLWAGEELTYNYHSDTLDDEFARQKCLCGARRCSGFIGGQLKEEEEESGAAAAGARKRKKARQQHVATAAGAAVSDAQLLRGLERTCGRKARSWVEKARKLLPTPPLPGDGPDSAGAGAGAAAAAAAAAAAVAQASSAAAALVLGPSRVGCARARAHMPPPVGDIVGIVAACARRTRAEAAAAAATTAAALAAAAAPPPQATAAALGSLLSAAPDDRVPEAWPEVFALRLRVRRAGAARALLAAFLEGKLSVEAALARTQGLVAPGRVLRVSSMGGAAGADVSGSSGLGEGVGDEEHGSGSERCRQQAEALLDAVGAAAPGVRIEEAALLARLLVRARRAETGAVRIAEQLGRATAALQKLPADDAGPNADACASADAGASPRANAKAKGRGRGRGKGKAGVFRPDLAHVVGWAEELEAVQRECECECESEAGAEAVGKGGAGMVSALVDDAASAPLRAVMKQADDWVLAVQSACLPQAYLESRRGKRDPDDGVAEESLTAILSRASAAAAAVRRGRQLWAARWRGALPDALLQGGGASGAADGTSKRPPSAAALAATAKRAKREAARAAKAEQQAALAAAQAKARDEAAAEARAAATRPLAAGDLVDVAARSWPGINKAGGAARIAAVREGEYDAVYTHTAAEAHAAAGISFDVKYLLGGSEKRVPAHYCKRAGAAAAVPTMGNDGAGGGGRRNRARGARGVWVGEQFRKADTADETPSAADADADAVADAASSPAQRKRKRTAAEAPSASNKRAQGGCGASEATLKSDTAAAAAAGEAAEAQWALGPLLLRPAAAAAATHPGSHVRAQWTDGTWYNAVVKRSVSIAGVGAGAGASDAGELAVGQCDVLFDDPSFPNCFEAKAVAVRLSPQAEAEAQAAKRDAVKSVKAAGVAAAATATNATKAAKATKAVASPCGRKSP
eukprot:g3153.t1